jgi:predicted kinase
VKQKLNIERFSSDRIRKTLADLPLEQRPPAEERKELYTQKMSDQTYQTLLEKMVQCVKNKRPVILDATFNSRQARRRLIDRLANLDIEYVFVETTAPEAVIKDRLRKRSEQQDVVSDARLEDYQLLKDRYDPPAELDESDYLGVATDQSLQDTLLDLYRSLADKNMALEKY